MPLELVFLGNGKNIIVSFANVYSLKYVLERKIGVRFSHIILKILGLRYLFFLKRIDSLFERINSTKDENANFAKISIQYLIKNEYLSVEC